MSVLSSTDSCASTAGSGMVTTWALAGSTTAYAGSLSTDGYQLTATATWVAPGNTSPAISGETITANANMVLGTCVETLDSAGAAVAATVTDNGNFAICHFVYYTFSASPVPLVAAQTGTNDWGATMYLTTTQWGTAGTGLIGTSMNTATGGTAITSATWGMVLSPAAATGTTTIAVGTKTWVWYQPTYATTYASSALRRYGGGYNNSTADQVKGYCIGAHSLLGVANVPTGIVAAAAKVTLSGASALAAGAIAFGVAALAI
jgi:hypothetical protein